MLDKLAPAVYLLVGLAPIGACGAYMRLACVGTDVQEVLADYSGATGAFKGGPFKGGPLK